MNIFVTVSVYAFFIALIFGAGLFFESKLKKEDVKQNRNKYRRTFIAYIIVAVLIMLGYCAYETIIGSEFYILHIVHGYFICRLVKYCFTKRFDIFS